MNKVTTTIFSSIAVLLAVLFWVQSSTAKSVITVEELLEGSVDQKALQLGARVTEAPINYEVEPKPFLTFTVKDPAGSESKTLNIEYQGIMPDTLTAGRDVIVQGDFVDGKFVASNLVTQCPSKYEPPKIEG